MNCIRPDKEKQSWTSIGQQWPQHDLMTQWSLEAIGGQRRPTGTNVTLPRTGLYTQLI